VGTFDKWKDLAFNFEDGSLMCLTHTVVLIKKVVRTIPQLNHYVAS
jgi:hypothetical protein